MTAKTMSQILREDDERWKTAEKKAGKRLYVVKKIRTESGDIEYEDAFKSPVVHTTELPITDKDKKRKKCSLKIPIINYCIRR